jgi:hypothetical protein
MNTKITVCKALAILIIFLLTSCASTKDLSSDVSVFLPKPANSIWEIHDARLTMYSDDIFVRGKLFPNAWSGLPNGHIDVAAYAPSGKLLFENALPWKRSSSLIRKRRFRGPIRFFGEINVPLPPDSIVVLAFHSGNRFPKREESHKNIAKQKDILSI